MQLHEAIMAVAQNPGSTKMRVILASILQQYSAQHASLVWEAAARVAAAKGDFFDALSICRLHLSVTQQKSFLKELLNNYMNPPSPNEALPSTPQARLIQLQNDQKALLQQALQIGSDLTGIRLTHHVSMPEIPILGGLSEDLLFILLQYMIPIPLQSGDLFINQGDKGNACYLVTHGQIQVNQRRPDDSQMELARLNAPTITGEIALLTAVSRRASVGSLTQGLAWRIDAKLISHLNKKNPSLFPQIRTLIRTRLVDNLTHSNKLFANLTEEERLPFIQAFSMLIVKSAETVLKVGERTSGLFIVLHGKAFVKEMNALGEMETIAELSEGSVFGSPSFFTGKPSKTAVDMPEGGLLLRLVPNAYKKLCVQFTRLDQNLRELSYIRY